MIFNLIYQTITTTQTQKSNSMKTNLLKSFLFCAVFGLVGVSSLSAQTKSDVTVLLHEPMVSDHEPSTELHEPGIFIHEPGFELHEPGFQNQGPGHNSADKMRLKLYPNPTVDFVNIASEHYHFMAYSIYTNTGEMLSKGVFDVPDHTAQIDVTALVKGTYILVVQADHSAVTVKRFVKQ